MKHDLTTELVPLDVLAALPGNARRGDVGLISESRDLNGQYRPLVVNRGTYTGRPNEVVAGNHTLQAARRLGWDNVAVSWIDVDENALWRIALVDNRANDVADYDDGLLVEALARFQDDFGGTGFDKDAYAALAAAVPVGDMTEDDTEQPPERGALLALADLGWDEPEWGVRKADHWIIGHHHLFAVSPQRDWQTYVPFLEPGMILAPYPNPYITGSEIARETPLILVQPRTILAGHLMNKHRSIFPKDRIERVEESE